MKSIRFSFLTVALWSTFTCIPEMARGQLELAIRLDYRVYLRFEPIIARTEVKSRIGQPVVFNAGGNNPRFYYEVRDVDGHVLSPLPELAPPPPVLAAAQDDLIFTNDMTRLFAMRDPGQYSIQPCIDWMGKTYRGDKQHLEVVAGREVSRITGVVPDDGTTRTYMTFHINRGHQDHLLLRIDDEPANLCFGVFALGRSVMNVQPELAIDGSGRAHILFQSAPRTFTHAIYSPRGALVDSQTFGRDYSLVSLQSLPNGNIEAVGQRDAKREGPPVIDTILDKR